MILGLADQQLATGVCLLISGYIKAESINVEDYYGGAHFSLIVYLSCLSSSSHLAALITLRKYFETYKFSAILRVCLVTLYAALLSSSIMIGGTFRPFVVTFFFALGPIDFVLKIIPFSNFLFTYVLPIFLILYVFWLAIIQLDPKLRRLIKQLIRRYWLFCYLFFKLGNVQACYRTYLNTTIYTWLSWTKRCLKTVFWHCLFASPLFVFLLQIAFAVISLTFTFAQEFMRNPDLHGCDLAGSEEDYWGFGQTLSMFFLLLPVWSAIETYIGKRFRECHVAPLLY